MPDPSLRGRLLVAQPSLKDPNFARTVVLVLQHSDSGAVGVVLNRPTDVGVGGPLPAWSGMAAPPAVLFMGGPVVEEGTAICLARVRHRPPAGVFTPVLGSVGTLDVNQAPAETGGTVEEVRLFAGYAGWGAGQLEGELRAGGWFVVDARAVDGFTSDPGGLWAAVLGRQRGELAWFVHFPPDPAFN